MSKYRADWSTDDGQLHVRDFGSDRKKALDFARSFSARPAANDMSHIYVIVSDGGKDVGQKAYVNGFCDYTDGDWH